MSYTVATNVSGVSPVTANGSSTSVTVNITVFDYINITLTADTDCGTSPQTSTVMQQHAVHDLCLYYTPATL